MKNTYNLYLKNKQNKLVSASENPFKTESELEEYIMKTPEIFSDIFIIKRQIKAGKWVVSKNEKIIASDKSFAKLQLKIKNRKDSKTLMYSLVPKGFIVG